MGYIYDIRCLGTHFATLLTNHSPCFLYPRKIKFLYLYLHVQWTKVIVIILYFFNLKCSFPLLDKPFNPVSTKGRQYNYLTLVQKKISRKVRMNKDMKEWENEERNKTEGRITEITETVLTPHLSNVHNTSKRLLCASSLNKLKGQKATLKPLRLVCKD